MVGAIADLLRWVFTWLDVAVYWLIDQLYWLFTMLTEVSIFTSDQIESFSSRIYVLISIIMLFKLGFSFITYIVNPDSFTDKQKGGTALLKNIVVVVVLLASVPTIFNEAYHLQQLIFKNNVIDRILLGDTSERNDTYVDENGNTQNVEQSNILSTYAFLSFFRPNASISGCDTFEGISISDQCVSSLNASVKDESNPGNAYKKAVDTLNIYYVLNSQIPTTKGVATTSDSDDFYMTDEFYLFDYHWGISTIFGGAIAWILLGFCMDLAVRAVKLSFLQIIAPIPIILSLSPGKKNNTLGNWGKECLSTWVSLFIRVMVISFAMTAIMLINSDGGVFSIITGGRSSYFMVNVFIMLGLLLFAKEFPKLLEDILGLKGAGKLTLNPWKKLGSVPLVGGAMTAGLSLAGNTVKNIAAFGAGKLLGRETHFKENMGFAGKEALGRFKASGFAGSDKGYSGDTQHKLVSKRNQDMKTKIHDAKKDLHIKDKQWKMGNESNQKIKLDENSTPADYRAAGFRDSNFINAAIGLDKTKAALKDEQSKLRKSNENVSALTNSLYNLENSEMDKNSTEYIERHKQLSENLENATSDRDKYVESVEKIEKTLSSRKEVFEKNIMPLNSKDTELYNARSVAKGERPTSYGANPSLPTFNNPKYVPGQYTSNTQNTNTTTPQPGGTNTQTPNPTSTQSDTNPFNDRGFGS